MWDTRPWTPELRAEREALSLIHSLRAQVQSPSEWLDAITADRNLTELRRGGPTRPPIRPRMEMTALGQLVNLYVAWEKPEEAEKWRVLLPKEPVKQE